MVLLIINGSVLVQGVSSGVHAGDYFNYSIVTHWDSVNSSLTSPPNYLVYNNQTKMYNVSVYYAADADVIAMNTWEYYNGTTDFARVEMEVENGTVYLATSAFAFQGFYAAKLNAGDLLQPLRVDGLRINETVTRDYASGKRDTNVVSVSYQVRDYYNISIGTETVTYYIDKATGIMVERLENTVFPDQTGSIEWKLVATNLWVVSSQSYSIFEIALIIAVILIIIGLLFYFYMRRRKNRH